VFFQAWGTSRGMNAQVLGPPTADHEAEFAGQHPGDLVGVAVQMEQAGGTGRQGFPRIS
jgi:hypothetical protein